MPKMKPYSQLSERQKYRRLAQECEKDLKEINEALSIDKNEDSSEENFQGYEDISIGNNIDSDHVNSTMSDVEMQISEAIVEPMDDEMFDNSNTDNLLDQEYAQSQEFLDVDERDIFSDEYTDSSSSEDSSSTISGHTLDEDIDEFNLSEALKTWQQENFIGRESLNQLLGILREAGHTELPKDTRTLLGTPKQTKITPCVPGEYLHYGLQQCLEAILKDQILDENIIIDVNIDGLPITKSTKRTLWPIQGKLVDYDNTPFIIGVYHGNKKPESATEYLSPFIKECKKLNQDGFIFRNKTYKVFLRYIICDSPAANFVTCTKQYNGYFGCRKCMVEGDYNHKCHRMTFLKEDADLRTNENFRNRSNEKHHKGTSPFEDLPIDMVNAFPLDSMHLIFLGVTKLLITLWLTVNPKFSATDTKLVSDSLMTISKFVPKEFNRKTQSLADLNYWKATNFRFFLLYVGPIIMKGFIPDDYLLNFNTLSCAIRILCHPEDYAKNNQFAKLLLMNFLRNFKTLYGKQYVTSNVHMAGTHLAAEAERIGPLDVFAAWDYENNMKFVKKILKKNERPLQQIHRRLTEQHRPSSKKEKKRGIQYPILKIKNKRFIPFRCQDSFKKLIFKNFELSTQEPDNCCTLMNGDVIVIEYIGTKDNDIVVIGKKFLKMEGIKNYPIDSTEMGICAVKKLSNLEVFSTKMIHHKSVLFLDNDKQYVVPLLHN